MDEKIVKLGDALMALTTAEAVELQKYLESIGKTISKLLHVKSVANKVL